MSFYTYNIVCKVNNKKYYGSTNNTRLRFNKHKSMLRNNNHHSAHLQYAWNKYGENNFDFMILNSFDNEIDMINNENKLLNENYTNSYNMSKIAETSFSRGRKPSLSTINKIKLARAKQIMTNHTKETIEKIKQARKNQVMKRVVFITELGIFAGYDNLCAAHNIHKETARKWIRDGKVDWDKRR